jgi:catechol 2,3-dioxygenase-like lactoylglutathione lyase family enzyme
MKKSLFGFERIKVIAIPVQDISRARRFYGETLALEPAFEGKEQVGFFIGDTILMLKENFYAAPTEMPNPRITIAVDHAPDTGKALSDCGVVIRDRVQAYDDGFYIGSFLDSEGNKLWFCSPVGKY